MKLFVAAVVVAVAMVVTSASYDRKSAWEEKSEDELLDALLEKLQSKKVKTPERTSVFANIARLDFDNDQSLTNADMLKLLMLQAKATGMFKKRSSDKDIDQELECIYLEFGLEFDNYDADNDGNWDYTEMANFMLDEFNVTLDQTYFNDLLELWKVTNNELDQKDCFISLMAMITYYEIELATGQQKKVQLKNKMSRLAMLAHMDSNKDNRLDNTDMLNFLVGKAKSSNMLKKSAAMRDADVEEIKKLYQQFESDFEQYDEDGDGSWSLTEFNAWLSGVTNGKVEVDQDYFNNMLAVVGSTDSELTLNEAFVFYLSGLVDEELTALGFK